MRHAQPRSERRRVAAVPVEELQHGARRTERRHARIDAGEVDRIDEPDAAVGGERGRGDSQPGRLGRDPAEAAVALVADDRGSRCPAGVGCRAHRSAYQPCVPGSPLNGPTSSRVIQPP
jgi:hypothetical protein